MASNRLQIALVLPFLFAAFGSVADDADKVEKEKKKKSNPCINARRQVNFSPMTDEYVFVESGLNKYLLIMKHRCRGIRQGYYINFQGDSRRVCSNHRAQLEYTDREIRMPACRIQKIEEVDDWNEASSIVNQLEREKKEEEQKGKRESE
jgi:hypothetical protein